MSGKSQTIGDFTVSQLSQILPTNENSKSWVSPIIWDGRGQIGSGRQKVKGPIVWDFSDI